MTALPPTRPGHCSMAGRVGSRCALPPARRAGGRGREDVARAERDLLARGVGGAGAGIEATVELVAPGGRGRAGLAGAEADRRFGRLALLALLFLLEAG